MLDQADFIDRYDKENAVGVVADQPDQLKYAYDKLDLSGLTGVRQIVLAGMGGSAIQGEFVKNWLGDRLPLPFVIVRDYALPGFVGPETLVIVSSYSGNTEETISALADAEKRGAKIVVLASGGKLAEAAKAKGYPHFQQPAGMQPRLAVLYSVRALAELLEGIGLLEGLVGELEAAADWVAGVLKDWTVGVPVEENVAKQIAAELLGHVVIMYGGPTLALPAMKWKIDFNENSKNLAFYNYFPEFSHNEFIGWSHPERSGLKVVELRSHLDHPQIQKRFDVTNKLLSASFAPIEVYADGDTRLQQMLWAIILGDFVSVYLAVSNQVDPMPVDLVERMKKELA